MALSKNDITKISYKARLDWYKKRLYSISDDDAQPELQAGVVSEFLDGDVTPEEVLLILDDIKKKARKLDKRIDIDSAGLRLLIDKDKQPVVSQAVSDMDSSSNGEYITYELYVKLLEQKKAAEDELNLDDIINYSTGDISSDSMLVQDRMSSGAAGYPGLRPGVLPEDNSLERYVNKYLNNIFSWNEHLRKIREILDYADDSLDRNTSPKFIQWKVKRDVYYEIGEISNVSDAWKHFSEYYGSNKEKLVGGIKKLTNLTPDEQTTGITKRYISYTNDFLNEINEIFNMNYGVDLICCFVSWAGGFNTKTLKGLRSLLVLLQNGLVLDFNDANISIKNITNNIFRNIITHQLVSLVTQVFQSLIDPVKKWVNNPDPRWQKIFVCTPVDEFVNNYVVNTIDYVERLLAKLIKKWYKQNELKNIGNGLKLTIIKEQKGLGTFINLLDLVSSALNRSAICGTGSSPTGEEIKRLMDAYDLGPSEQYKYTEEENPNSFNSFIQDTTDSGDEDTQQGTSVKSESGILTTSVGTSRSEKMDTCLRRLVSDDRVLIKEWINAKNQGK